MSKYYDFVELSGDPNKAESWPIQYRFGTARLHDDGTVTAQIHHIGETTELSKATVLDQFQSPNTPIDELRKAFPRLATGEEGA